MLAASPGKRIARSNRSGAPSLEAIDAEASKTQQAANRHSRNAGIKAAIPFLHADISHRHVFRAKGGRFDVGKANPEFVQQVGGECLRVGKRAMNVLGGRILTLAQADASTSRRELSDVGVEELAGKVVVAEEIAV